MITYVDIKCDWCLNYFKREKRQTHTKQKHSFCSQECNSKFVNTKIDILCMTCGKCITKYKEYENSFCSRSCSAIFSNAERKKNGYSTKGRTIESQCLECNKNIIVSIHRSKSYCLECRKIRRQAQRRHFSTKDYKPSKTKIFNLICQHCNTIFYCNNKYKKYCTKECTSIKWSQNAVNNIISGKTIPSGGIKTIFLFKEKEIKCDSLLEYACLKYFINNFDVQKINRCDFSIPYIFENKNYKYIPDFIVETINKKIIIECKSHIGKSLSNKWHNYKEKSIIKQQLLKDYAKENNMNYVWFSPEIPIFRKIYNEVKKNKR